MHESKTCSLDQEFASRQLQRTLELQADYFNAMSPQAKDRLMQEHLAAASSRARKLANVLDMTAFVLSLRAQAAKEGTHDGR